MTTASLLPDLRRDEGLRLDAYPDPESGAEPYTIGYGHTGAMPDGSPVALGDSITADQAEALLEADVASTEHALDMALAWWRTLDDVRQDALCNMAFNLGVTKLCGFHNFLDFMEGGDFDQAADDDIHTLWARQVGDRATRIAGEIRTGVAE